MRVFLDANVLVSAAYREGASIRVFFELAAAGACVLVTSPHAIEEARRNLASKRPQRVAELERLLGAIEVCAEPGTARLDWAASVGLPAKDAPILAAAVESGCPVLVTGDRTDFGALFGQRPGGTLLMLPAEALELLVA
jgi:predicted nucleic acid-binding protein